MAQSARHSGVSKQIPADSNLRRGGVASISSPDDGAQGDQEAQRGWPVYFTTLVRETNVAGHGID